MSVTSLTKPSRLLKSENKNRVYEDKIQEMILIFQERSHRANAHLGFYHQSGKISENCIKANRQGLELYVIELLKAIREADKNTDMQLHEINTDWVSYDSDYLFRYIEFHDDQNGLNDHYDALDTLSKAGYILICMAGLIILGIGFVTIFSWFG